MLLIISGCTGNNGCFDLVTVEIANERAVIVGTVVRPRSGFAIVFAACFEWLHRKKH